MKSSFIKTTPKRCLVQTDPLWEQFEPIVQSFTKEELSEHGIKLYLNRTPYYSDLPWFCQQRNVSYADLCRKAGCDLDAFWEDTRHDGFNNKLLNLLLIVEQEKKLEKVRTVVDAISFAWWDEGEENPCPYPVWRVGVAFIEKKNHSKVQEMLALEENKEIQELLESALVASHLSTSIDFLDSCSKIFDVSMRWLLAIDKDYSFYGYSPEVEILFDKIKMLPEERQSYLFDVLSDIL